MNTDITYCANHKTCTVAAICKRARVPKDMDYFWQATFTPEKGLKCKGFWKKAPLSLKPLENEQ